MMTFNYVLNKIKNPDDIKDIKEAYEYANSKLSGIMRKNGDTEISHCLEVANILIDLNVDKETIICAILHSVLDFNDIDEKEIVENFSLETYKIIFSLSKINNLEMVDDSESAALYLRKVMVGLSEDVRVLFIKLADRLHNMRTLSFKSEFKQKENAMETMDLFVPLAYCIGAYRLKSELEDLSLQYLYPDKYKKLSEIKLKVEEDSTGCLEEMLATINKILSDKEIPHEIKVRTKNIYGIYKRLEQGHQVDNIHDLLSLKVMVDNIANCYYTLGLVHSKYHPINNKFKDYISTPKTNMYQSLHTTVFGLDDRLVQTQIRTFDMDKIASFGLTAYWDINKGNARDKMQKDLKEKYQFFNSLLEINKAFSDNQDFVRQVKEELFSDKIYVYTTKGETIELPKDSSVVDFAYRIHTSLGNSMTGALVNNEMVDFDFILHSKDRVKILNDTLGKGPSEEWLSYVKTTKAKRKIKEYRNM